MDFASQTEYTNLVTLLTCVWYNFSTSIIRPEYDLQGKSP
jgi:hypothetical protein